MEGRRRFRTGPQQDADFVPRKKARGQRPVDFFSSAIWYLKQRPYGAVAGASPFQNYVPPHGYHCKDLLPPGMTAFNPSTALCTQWAHTAQYPDMTRFQQAGDRRRRVFFTTMQWSPSGRKLLCATTNGEFVVYNGTAFSVELKTTAHEDGRQVRALAWGKRTDAVLSGDDSGVVKLWATNFNLAAEFESNQRAVRDVAWAIGEARFATAGQDGSVKIWDTERVATTSASGVAPEVETKLEGHGGEVLNIAWHPTKALLASVSMDRSVRLWDPRKGKDNQLCALQGHTEPISSGQWHPSREWCLLTAGRDSTARLWDARMMKETCRFVGHTSDISGVDWHPTHADLFVTCGLDGLIAFWTISHTQAEVTKWAAALHAAHEQQAQKANGVACVRFSPIGHVLASCAAEVHVWTRNKPGAEEEIRVEVDEQTEVVLPTGGSSAAVGFYFPIFFHY